MEVATIEFPILPILNSSNYLNCQLLSLEALKMKPLLLKYDMQVELVTRCLKFWWLLEKVNEKSCRCLLWNLIMLLCWPNAWNIGFRLWLWNEKASRYEMRKIRVIDVRWEENEISELFFCGITNWYSWMKSCMSSSYSFFLFINVTYRWGSALEMSKMYVNMWQCLSWFRSVK